LLQRLPLGDHRLAAAGDGAGLGRPLRPAVVVEGVGQRVPPVLAGLHPGGGVGGRGGGRRPADRRGRGGADRRGGAVDGDGGRGGSVGGVGGGRRGRRLQRLGGSGPRRRDDGCGVAHRDRHDGGRGRGRGVVHRRRG